MKKWFKRLGIILLIITSLLVGVNFYIQTHKEEITQFVLDSINKEIDAQIAVPTDQVSLSLFSDFPNVSLALNKLTVTPNTSKESLVQVESFSASLRFWDLFEEEKKIQKLTLKDGRINLQKDSKGLPNYFIFSKKDTFGGSISLNIDQLNLENVYLFYKDYTFQNSKPRTELALNIEKGSYSLDINGDSLQIHTDNQLYFKYFNSSGISLLNEVPTDLEGDFVFDMANSVLEISKSNLNFGKTGSRHTIVGEIDMNNKSYNRLDLLFDSKKMTKNQLFEISNQLNLFSEFSEVQQANIVAVTKVKGVLASWKNPSIQIAFKVDDAHYKDEQFNFSDIGFEAQLLNNDKGLKIESDSVHVRFMDQEWKTKLIYENSKYRNNVNLKLDGDIKLDKLTNLISTDDFNLQSGILHCDDVQLNYDLNKDKLDYTAELSAENVFLDYDHYNIELKSAKLNLNSKRIRVLSSNLLVNKQDLKYSGTIDLEDFYLKGNVESSSFKMNALLSDNDDPVYLADLPAFNLKVDCKSFEYDNIHLTDVSMNIKNEDNFITSSYFKMNAMGGEVVGSGKLHQFQKENLYFSLDGKARNLDVNALFTQMDNFGQTTLMDKHLKGRLTSSFFVDFQYDNKFNLILNSIDFKGKTIVQNGELIDFRPLDDLSKYISLTELRHIKFKDLENRISIKDGIVHIPNMRILSNAINIEIEGTHDFDNNVDYRLRLKLNSILSKNKSIKKNKEVDFDEQGEANIFLIMKGPMDDPTIKYDRKKAQAQIKQNIKGQGSKIKKALDKEFNKKKSNQMKIEDVEEEQDEFIDWDDDGNS